eukprot:COSAG02_NODE_4183_length_5655_cov_6.673326_6_plen_466_part_00
MGGNRGPGSLTMQNATGMVGLEPKDLHSKVEQLCEKMEAVVGMWWTLDGDKLKVAVTVTKQPQKTPAAPEAFVAESMKKQFQPGDSSAVSRVFTSKEQIWMPAAKNDTSYHRKDLAAQTNIASIGLIHMDGGVFEYAFEQPRLKPPVLHLSGEPLDDPYGNYEDAEEGVIRWSQKKNSVLLSPAERKRRRLESNRAAAKRAYYRRLNKTETQQHENSKLRDQLEEERSKVAVYENLLLRLGVNPAGALALIKGQAHTVPTIPALGQPRNQPETRETAHVTSNTLAVASVPTQQLKPHKSALTTSASCPTLLGHGVPAVYANPPSPKIQDQMKALATAPNTSTFSFSQPTTGDSSSSSSSSSNAVPDIQLSIEAEPAVNQTSAMTYTIPTAQTDPQRKLAELAERQEKELMSLEQQHRLQLSGAALNANCAYDPIFTTAGPSLSNMEWTEDLNDLESPDEYSSAPE